MEPPDSDEEVLERILKLPPQVCHSKQLSSIPEVTEEEDSSQEERLSSRSHPRPKPGHPRDSECFHQASQYQQHHPNPHPHVQPYHHHFNRDPRSLTKEPLLRHGPMQVRPKTQHRVHYADTVDTINYPEEDESLYEGPTNRRVSARCPPQPTPNSKEKVLLRGLGDRLRREAMLRSQMAVTTAANPSYGLTPPRPYPLSKTVRTLRTPIVCGGEIDVEYGTDDNEEPVEYNPGEVMVEQMSSEWWVEGAQAEHHRPQRRGLKADQLVNVAAGQPPVFCQPLPPSCSLWPCGSNPLSPVDESVTLTASLTFPLIINAVTQAVEGAYLFVLELKSNKDAVYYLVRYNAYVELESLNVLLDLSAKV